MLACIIFVAFVIACFLTFVYFDEIYEVLRKIYHFFDDRRIMREKKKADAKRLAEKDIKNENARDNQSVNEWRKCPGYGIGTSDCFCCDWDGSGRPPCY